MTEPTFEELTAARTLAVHRPPKRKVQTKTRCKRCLLPVKREAGEYMHVDEQWRSEKRHGHLAEARYERHANT